MTYPTYLPRRLERSARVLMALGLSMAISACTNNAQFYEGPSPASVGNLTAQNLALRDVAPPSNRVVVSVYRFPDLTGQYKERDFVQSLSRAVPQAGAPLLITALQDAGQGSWFTVLDRESLQDVVQERQIIERMREQYRGETPVNPSVLGPLMHAGIIVTGGIIGYDSNLQTGGAGARFLGIGANTEWKYDIVSVSLRAISTETGEVLASVVARKPLASIKGQGDVFRFVELDKLLEAEVGLATNEPRQIAVQQAVEKAVMGLIAEGAMRGIWHFQSSQEQSRFIAGYRNQLFNGEVPTDVSTPRPATVQAANIPQTRPVRRPAPEPARIERNVPEPFAPNPPPPAGQDEVLGSLTRDVL